MLCLEGSTIQVLHPPPFYSPYKATYLFTIFRYEPWGMYLSILDDDTNDEGVIWQTWKNVVLMDDDDDAEDDNRLCWTRFRGEWGNKAKDFLAHPGQWGPSMKGCYRRGDVPMTRTNTSRQRR